MVLLGDGVIAVAGRSLWFLIFFSMFERRLAISFMVLLGDRVIAVARHTLLFLHGVQILLGYG